MISFNFRLKLITKNIIEKTSKAKTKYLFSTELVMRKRFSFTNRPTKPLLPLSINQKDWLEKILIKVVPKTI